MDALNPSQAAALVLVDELARCGVTDAVLAPGSRSAALAMVLHDEPRIRLHVEIDERSAGFLALGLARATGRIAPVVVTSGSAVANLHPAVVEADRGHVPLLLITADRPPELRHTGANQAIDQGGIFGSAVRWHADLGVPEDRETSNALWRSSVCRAVAAATGSGGAAGSGAAPAGPVHLNLPLREPSVPLSDDGRSPASRPFAATLEGRPQRAPWTRVTAAPRRLEDEELRGLAARILGTERGMIVVGASTPGSGVAAAAPAIHELARAAGWPVIAEPSSGARTEADTVAAHAPLLLSHPRFARWATPDLVLRIGRSGLSRELAALLGPHVPQLLLGGDGAWDDPDRAIGEFLVADVAATCASLAVSLGLPASSAWSQRWRAADDLARRTIDPLLDAREQPSEPRTARDLLAALPDGASLVVASSMPIRDVDRFAAPREQVRVLANRGASGIDGFVSTALGVALGVGVDGPVVALTGDLSLLHDANGFHLAAAADHLDVTFVVVDNDGGGIFSFLPQAGFEGSFERVFGTPHGRDLSALARWHGLGYERVTDAARLPAAVGEAIEAGGLRLVHVRTDRADNRALHEELRTAVHAALDDLDVE
ncbi:MAG: 2-succinyl-5-enolpyruvyl-6-hydroxy-3-cyclohexene-1-carboxylic-acid synthase [Nitriliruptoraceae bacterium]